MKKKSIRNINLFLAAIIAVALLAQPLTAQAEYPEKPITFLVGFAAGGPTDVIARIVAQSMSNQLKQQIIVENRAGASGIIAANAAAKAAADGYTLFFAGQPELTLAPNVYKNLQYDPIKDFSVIGSVADHKNVLAVNPNSKINTLKDYIDAAKAAPDTITYASAGKGSPAHLVAELCALETGIKLKHIPYKGAGPGLTDLLGGQVDSMFIGVPAAMAHIKSGKLRAVAVTGTQRLPNLPDVPTFAEIGYPNIDMASWWAIVGPEGLDQKIIDTLRKALKDALQDEATLKLMASQGLSPRSDAPDQIKPMIQQEIDRWAKVIKESGITLE